MPKSLRKKAFVAAAWYRGTSLTGTPPLLGPYSRTIPGVIWWSQGGWRFLMSEAPLQRSKRSDYAGGCAEG